MRRKLAAFAFLFLLAGSMSFSEQVSEYLVKAEFIERFTRFIDWPPSPPEHTTFVIAVVGDDPFSSYLRDLQVAHKIKGREIEIRHLSASDPLGDCDVLFISSSERKNLASILEKTATHPVLTIGDSSGYAEKGVLINFYSAGDRVRFEINEGAVERSGLKVSSKLFKLARVVGGEER